MTGEEFREHGHAMIEWIASYLETVRDRRVLPQVKPGDVLDALPAHGPALGETFGDILRDFESTILPGSTLWNHPRFFSYFSVSSSPESMLAEFLSAALNQNGILWKSGPALTELELAVLGWLREWLGLPERFFGVIYDTASISTMHALIAARQAVAPETREQGATANLTVYTSEQAHSSVEKGALALGFGAANVRKIASDSEFRMDVAALERAIEEDVRAGKRPCAIVPSIGATPTAALDPVSNILPIARACGAWLHVDAAYAGPAAMLEECRWMFDGWEQADSVVMNPQKWMLVNVDCSVLYLARREALSGAISLTPEYLRTQSDPRLVNYMDYSVALGRRFRALKLWFVMRSYGRDGIAKMLREHIGMAQWLAAQVQADSRFELVAPVHLSLICFRLRDSNEANQRLMDAINDSGFAFLSHTVQNGKFVLRFAIGNYMTTQEDVAQTWQRIQALAG
ncbi:MAG: pyridoxal-dependent decarboxylase [Bryobacteraceae bacterium]|nr:pyridoxal-dependent decarboxylase [Bryobacteraceae bacterium]